MKPQPVPFFNYNQMLVVSVFFHFFLLIVLMYMPKANLKAKIIKPAFMVDLVEIPTGNIKKAPPVQKAKKKPVPKKPDKPVVRQTAKKPPAPPPVPKPEAKMTTKPKPIAKPKPVAPPKPVVASKPTPPPPPTIVQPKFSSAPKPVTVRKKQLNDRFTPKPLPKAAERYQPPIRPPAYNPLLEKLDEVAKLETGARPMPRKPATTNKPILDQTFQDLEALKKTRAARIDKPKMLAPAPRSDSLADFDALKMEDSVARKQQPRVSPTHKPAQRLSAEKEFQALARQENLNAPQSATDLDSLQKSLKELESIKKMKAERVAKVEPKPTPQFTPPASSRKTSVDPLLKKLDSMKKTKGLAISFDMAMNEDAKKPVEFKSSLRDLKNPDMSQPVSVPKAVAQSSKQMAHVESDRVGTPGANSLALYIGKIRKKVLDNWKDPLGGGHSKLLASFYIFPQGNIENPVLMQSSGKSRLDKLALKAITDSAPFPPFPKELREPNLYITINFSYVQKNP